MPEPDWEKDKIILAWYESGVSVIASVMKQMQAVLGYLLCEGSGVVWRIEVSALFGGLGDVPHNLVTRVPEVKG